DEEWFDELVARGVLSEQRRQELVRFAEGASILVQDVGGGTTHSTLSPRLLQALSAKSQRLVLAHTRTHALPETSSEMAERIEFAASGSVVGLGAPLPDDGQIELVETIAACPLFARLSTHERLNLARQIEVVNVPDGGMIFREGDPSDGCAYIVHSGVVSISIGEAPVRVLGRGSSIGERGALLGGSRTRTLVAQGQVSLLRLRAEVFRSAAERLGLATACARADWLAKRPVLGELPWASLLDLALDFEPRSLSVGERLFASGEPGYEGYLLVEGAVHFSAADGLVVDELHQPGRLFGYQAALYGACHSLTARAAAPTIVWALPAPALERLNLLYPQLLLHLRALGGPPDPPGAGNARGSLQ
ncbi:MAG: cyclic nucleotide-binding domain-containing protein, partial [Chloroflexaceae bacterium]